MVEPDTDSGFADAEVFRERGWGLDAVSPGVLEGSAWDEGAAGEEVGGTFGLLMRGSSGAAAAVQGAGVELVGVAVVDDVFELVQQREALPDFGVASVEADDPFLPVPVTHATDGEVFVDDADAWQVGDVLLGDAGELEARVLGGQELVEFRGLAFRDGEGFVEAAGPVRAAGSEALEDGCLGVGCVHGSLLSVKLFTYSLYFSMWFVVWGSSSCPGSGPGLCPSMPYFAAMRWKASVISSWASCGRCRYLVRR